MNKKLANILFCIGSVIVILYMVILFLGKNISPTLLGILMFISGLLCAPHTYFAYENDHEKDGYISTGTIREITGVFLLILAGFVLLIKGLFS